MIIVKRAELTHAPEPRNGAWSTPSGWLRGRVMLGVMRLGEMISSTKSELEVDQDVAVTRARKLCGAGVLVILFAIAGAHGSPAKTLSSNFAKVKKTREAEQGRQWTRSSQPKLGQILRSLLDDLDKVSNESDEIFDTDVRERMWDAVEKAFINPRPGYLLPSEFGMFTQLGNARVREALRRFIQRASAWAERNRVKSRESRLASFQDSAVASRKGSHYDDFFGHS
jgi:hypothetical protein